MGADDPDPSPATLDDGTEVPAYNGLIISKILKDFGRYDLLNYMNVRHICFCDTSYTDRTISPELLGL